MKKSLAIGALIFALVGAIAAPAAAYTQKTTYPGGSTFFKDEICTGYGGTEKDFSQTARTGDNVAACDFVQVRANYKNGAWVGYTSWDRHVGYAQVDPAGDSSINFGQHGLDSSR